MDNRSFVSRLTAKAGIPVERTTSLITAFADILAAHCESLDIVAIPQFGNFEGKKYDETITESSDGSCTLFPPKIEIEFTPGAMLKKTVKK